MMPAGDVSAESIEFSFGIVQLLDTNDWDSFEREILRLERVAVLIACERRDIPSLTSLHNPSPFIQSWIWASRPRISAAISSTGRGRV